MSDQSFDKQFSMAAIAMAYEKKIDELLYRIERLEACIASVSATACNTLYIDTNIPPCWRGSNMDPVKLEYCRDCCVLYRGRRKCECPDEKLHR